jgi:hypothetical protein
LIADNPKTAKITIVDVGCGNGDMLRTLADYGLTYNIKFNQLMLITYGESCYIYQRCIQISLIVVKIYLIKFNKSMILFCVHYIV